MIEIGCRFGGSALWFADMMTAQGTVDPKVISVDIDPQVSFEDARIEILTGDAANLKACLTPELLEACPRPWLVVEDSSHFHQHTTAVLDYFHPLLNQGDYIVVEDGVVLHLTGEHYRQYENSPNRAVADFLGKNGSQYQVDTELCDFYGPKPPTIPMAGSAGYRTIGHSESQTGSVAVILYRNTPEFGNPITQASNRSHHMGSKVLSFFAWWRRWSLRRRQYVGGAAVMDALYDKPDPWRLASAHEEARFAETDRLIIEACDGPIESILEVGCAEGLQTRHMLALADHVTGIDVSAQALARAAERTPHAIYLEGELTALVGRLPRERYTAVTFCEVLCYMADPGGAITAAQAIADHVVVTMYKPLAPPLMRYLSGPGWIEAPTFAAAGRQWRLFAWAWPPSGGPAV